MIHSILIVGGDSAERLKKAQNLSRQSSGPDFITVDCQTSIGIDQIRLLKRQISRKPFGSSIKTVFIARAELLTLTAQNALLKILEEPPAHTNLILSSPGESAMLPTIVSRCQIIRLAAKLPEITSRININFIEKLIKQSPGERIQTISPFCHTRDEALQLCQEMLLICHGNLTKKEFAPVARLTDKTEKLLQKNINPRLALENLVLSFPSYER